MSRYIGAVFSRVNIIKYNLGLTFLDWENLDEETGKPDMNPDFSNLYTHESQVKSWWPKKYCISFDIKFFFSTSQVNLTSFWTDKNGEFTGERELVAIYSQSECTKKIQNEKRTECIDKGIRYLENDGQQQNI